MDELIGTFIRAHFSQELVEEIYRSFGVFGLFNYGEGFEAFDGMLNMEEMDDASVLTDAFIDLLHKQLDYLLEHHTLKLNDSATIEQKNEILRGLYTLQYLLDYQPILRILESDADVEEKVCRILDELTEYDESLIMNLIESYRSSFIDNLKAFVYGLEVDKEQNATPIGAVGKHLRIYNQLFGQNAFVQTMVEAELLPAQEFKDYLPFLKDELVDPNSVEETTLRIYWLLLMSCDGTTNPLVVFREHSQELLTNVDRITQVEQRLLSFIGRFEELKKAVYEKA